MYPFGVWQIPCSCLTVKLLLMVCTRLPVEMLLIRWSTQQKQGQSRQSTASVLDWVLKACPLLLMDCDFYKDICQCEDKDFDSYDMAVTESFY